MALIIDPPVGPASAKADIEAWIVELDEMTTEHADDAEGLKAIADAKEEAREWLSPQERW